MEIKLSHLGAKFFEKDIVVSTDNVSSECVCNIKLGYEEVDLYDKELTTLIETLQTIRSYIDRSST